MLASRISAFRRLLTGLGRRVRQRPHAQPAGASAIRPSLDLARDPEMAQALVRLRDCLGRARELVPPEEWNAKLEWILGSKRDSKTHAADFDRKTVDAVVLWLEVLAASVNRTPIEPSKDHSEVARPDHLSRQSIVRKLRDATEGYALASSPRRGLVGPPDSQLAN